MLKGIDISNWQKGFSLESTKPGFCIVKATEGTNFTDKSCEGFVSECIRLGINFGYYHFANGSNNAAQQARYFRDHTKGYEGKGIPILDFENTYSNSWIDEFVKEYHTITGVYPWLYTSSDYINNRGYGSDYVKSNCGLWLAGYPKRATSYPTDATCPYKHTGWTLAAWQFTDRLSMGGMSVDGDIFYGDTSAWNLYATGGGAKSGGASGSVATGQTNTISGTDYQLARRVINGEFGNGAERRAVLGSRYDAVQSAVNLLLTGSDTALAKAVIAGKCGNGAERKTILGSRYNAVQKKVNSLLS